MIVTVFRSRLRDARREEYRNRAERMDEAARAMPGCLSHKTFTAEDGERVNIVEFESEKTHRAWAEHAEHRVAQRIGCERFYREYKIHVCEVRSTRSFHYRSNQTSLCTVHGDVWFEKGGRRWEKVGRAEEAMSCA